MSYNTKLYDSPTVTLQVDPMQSAELLQGVYAGAQTGIDAMQALKDRSEIHIFTSELEVLLDNYHEVASDAQNALAIKGIEAIHPNPIGQAFLSGSISLNTLMDNSPSQLSKMAIQGSTMGITEITKVSNNCVNADYEAKKIANDFITRTEEGIERLKDYL